MKDQIFKKGDSKHSSSGGRGASGFFRCRFCQKVGIAVFLSILILEGVILFYFSRNHEQERLAELERVNFAAIQSLVLGAIPSINYGGLLADAMILTGATEIRGGAFYSGNGRFVGVFGETPKTRLYATTGAEVSGRWLADNTRYEKVWRFTTAQPSLQMVVRLDATKVKAEVADFFWSILALVIVISVIVTAVTMFILDRLILAPVLSLRQSLWDAGENPSDPESHKVVSEPKDELGEAFRAFNRMLDQLSIRNEEIKQRQEALENSEGQLRDIVEASADWFWEMGPDLRFTFVSGRFFEKTGLPLQDVIGKMRMETIGPGLADEDPKLWKDHDEDLIHHRHFQDFEHPQMDSQGNARLVRVSGKPFYDGDGTFLGYRGAGTDITEYRRTEKELNHLKKMESLGSLAGGIAHNLNNLLQPIMILSEYNKSKLEEGTKIYKNMETIFEAGTRAKELVEKVAIFSRAKEPSRERADIYEAVREGLDLIRTIVPTSVTVLEKLDKTTGIVLLDTAEIQTVLMNLVNNSLDAMNGKAGELKILLSAIHSDDDSGRPVPGLKKGKFAKLTVADNGHGMKEETMNRIFDPFFTTKELGQGTGLGLSTAFGTITKHGGTIRVTSTPNVGSAFMVYLPLEETNSP